MTNKRYALFQQMRSKFEQGTLTQGSVNQVYKEQAPVYKKLALHIYAHQVWSEISNPWDTFGALDALRIKAIHVHHFAPQYANTLEEGDLYSVFFFQIKDFLATDDDAMKVMLHCPIERGAPSEYREYLSDLMETHYS